MAHAGEWNKMIDDLRVEMLAAVGLASGFGPVPWSRPAPPVGWVWADGSVLAANTPYTALRQAYIADGFPYGQDGSGNPKVPDMRGVVPAGRDNMGGVAANRLSGATAIGAIMGAEAHTLSAAEMPSHAHGVNDGGHAHSASTTTGGSHTHTVAAWSNSGGGVAVSATGAGATAQSSITSSSHAGHSHTVTVNGAGTGISLQNAGSGSAHNNVQPTIVMGYIVKT